MIAFLIVLDDDHRVADVAQALERFDQARVVALMQADRRLIEHIHDAGQAGADLAGQAYALRFTARQRVRRAVERQVVEADIDQKLQTIGYLMHDLVGNRAPRAGDIQRGKKAYCLIKG